MPATKKPFAPKYRQDPNGPGSRAQWRSAFRERLGMDAAREAVGDKTPEGILGIPLGSVWEVIKAAYRKLVRIHHPDIGGDPAEFRRIQGAFEILEDRFRK